MGTITRSHITVDLVALGHLSVNLEPPLVLPNTSGGTVTSSE